MLLKLYNFYLKMLINTTPIIQKLETNIARKGGGRTK